jgi:1,4-dihydroxy-2-naphthoate polyprenyltransferase
MSLRRLLFWFKASRPEFFTGAVVPVMVGGALAYHDTGHINWINWLLCAIALTLLQAMANMSNDYYDHLSGNDDLNTEFAHPFTGGSRVIQTGQAKPMRVLVVSLLCMGIAGAIGLYLAATRGWIILLIGIFGGLSGFFYTANPLKLGYRGFGEIFIGLDFGVLPVLATYYIQTGHFSWPAFVVSLPVALLIMAILWINQFQDFNADKAVNKLHWVVRLGRRRASFVYTGMILGSYVIILAGVITHLLPVWAAIALLTLVVAQVGIRTALRSYDDIPHLTPANAATVVIHLFTGVLLTLGVVIDKLVNG